MSPQAQQEAVCPFCRRTWGIDTGRLVKHSFRGYGGVLYACRGSGHEVGKDGGRVPAVRSKQWWI